MDPNVIDPPPPAMREVLLCGFVALTVEQLARMLGMPVGKVRDHVAAGAPTGPGGTINLVHYAAWLNRELGALAENDGD